MNNVERVLSRTHKTLHEACIEAGIDLVDAVTPNLDSCANCGIWHTKGKMRKDRDGDVICELCRMYYGD
jgi:hypothetical protein